MTVYKRQSHHRIGVSVPQEAQWWERFETKRLTGYPAGSLFLWDSRTVHQNSLPRDDQLWRCGFCQRGRTSTVMVHSVEHTTLSRATATMHFHT